MLPESWQFESMWTTASLRAPLQAQRRQLHLRSMACMAEASLREHTAPTRNSAPWDPAEAASSVSRQHVLYRGELQEAVVELLTCRQHAHTPFKGRSQSR